ncbi:MAG: TonB-dependent receptor [Prevotellaceae bacterium]|nr:TonB-dependent receptor [Prevotellaceae bacterium]
MQKILIFFLFNILTLNIVNAQQDLRVYGYAINDSNRGMEGVSVHIDGTPLTVLTNGNGYYELTLTKSDSMVLVFSLDGYETIRQVIHPQRNTLSITVEMQPVLHKLDEVGISAVRRQTSMMETLSPQNIRLTPNAAGGIEALLITMAGVSQNNELSSQYSVRGGNFDENSVYVNDIEVYRPLLVRSSQQEGLSFINPDLVENIAFSSGGFEPKYAEKMSSVLDIQYKKPKKAEASISLGLLGASLYVGTAAKRFTQVHAIRYKTSQYLLGTLDTKGEYKPSFIDYQTFMTFNLSPKTELSFLGNFSQNRYKFIPQTRETTFGTYNMAQTYTVFFDGWENDLFRTYFGALRFSFLPSKTLKMNLTASAYYTNENESYDITGAYLLSTRKQNVQGEIEGEPLGIGEYHEHARNSLAATVANITYSGEYNFSNNKLAWGVTGQTERISDKISEWKWNDSVGYSLPYDRKIFNLFYSLKSRDTLNSFRTTAYVQDTYRWESSWGRWTATGGARLNFWSVNKELLISPRAMIALSPFWKRDFTFRLATGVYYQTPFYKELRQIESDADGNSYIRLNTDIKAQRSVHVVAGSDYYFRAWGRPFKFTTEAYIKLADRVISYELENVNIKYSGLNDAKAYTAGIDFKLFGELIPGAETWLNFSLMDSKEKIDGKTFIVNGKAQEWIPRPNSQRFVLSALFQDYLPTNPKYRLHLRAIWSDGMPVGAPGNNNSRAAFRSTSYRRIDIGASRVFTQGEDKLMSAKWLNKVERIIFNIEIFNLLNINNVNSYYWISDMQQRQMAVPNYLTGRMFNFKIMADF